MNDLAVMLVAVLFITIVILTSRNGGDLEGRFKKWRRHRKKPFRVSDVHTQSTGIDGQGSWGPLYHS